MVVVVCVGGGLYHSNAINQARSSKSGCVNSGEREILTSADMNISLLYLRGEKKRGQEACVYVFLRSPARLFTPRCQSPRGMCLQGASSSHQRWEQFTHKVAPSPINNIQVALLLSEKLTGV